MLSLSTLSASAEQAFKIVWPTPNPAFHKRHPLEAYIQPTASGRIASGLFGCQRNNGKRFHEGIDLKALRHDSRGEAEDAVLAVMAGKVVYVNNLPGNSRYGRYIVLVHDAVHPSVYTLYAHLSHTTKGIRKGVKVQAGTILGEMGRSAGGYTIPKQRAHLHFEIGLRLSDHFQKWYDRQDFSNRNHHGIWNGMNLLGIDPLHFYEKMRGDPYLTVGAYFRNLPTALTLQVTTRKIPDFIRRYPTLLTQSLPHGGVHGWEIAFTGFGLPKSWKPLSAVEQPFSAQKKGNVVLLSHDKGQLDTYTCRNFINFSGQNPLPGKSLKRMLDMFFKGNL